MTPNQIKSQVFGIFLAFTTAIGCIAYERLVKSYSYFTVGLLCSLSYIPFFIGSLFFINTIKQDFKTLSINKWNILIYILSGITGPLWYLITRNQTVMVGAIYEVKFIIILALIYILFGTSQLSLNTIIGLCFAMLSIWFISK